MKKISDLKVGDKIYLKIDDEIETYEIKEIEKIKDIYVKFKFYGDRYLDFSLEKIKELEKDFIICYGDVKISTSMDRLLLEIVEE